MSQLPEEMLKSVEQTFVEREALLRRVSETIWDDPELGLQEFRAHDFLCEVLRKEGFDVKRNYLLPTAFRAEFCFGRADAPTIGFICEFDALPDIGHACGHNLISESAIGAAIAVKEALQRSNSVSGKVTVYGTPGEEGKGGKVLMLKKGAFRDLDVALMVHPHGAKGYLRHRTICSSRMFITFRGQEIRESELEPDGTNALDAAVSTYLGASLLRQYIDPKWRISGVITTECIPGVVPKEVSMSFSYRTTDEQDMNKLKGKIIMVASSAANLTGCSVQVTSTDPYLDMWTNDTLAKLFYNNLDYKDELFQDGIKKSVPLAGSTDMGNVSHVVSSIHPFYKISDTAVNHSREFTAASATDFAQTMTLSCSKAMALTALQILGDKGLLNKIRFEFLERKQRYLNP